MRNDGQVVLRVFLKAGPVVDLILSRPEAFNILEWWKSGPNTLVEGATPDGANYVLKADEIASLIVVPYQPQQQQQTLPPPGRLPPPGTIQFPGRQ